MDIGHLFLRHYLEERVIHLLKSEHLPFYEEVVIEFSSWHLDLEYSHMWEAHVCVVEVITHYLHLLTPMSWYASKI